MGEDRAVDPYTVLGIERNADHAEVKQAFRTLAMRYHPDMSIEPDAPRRFEEVRKAADEILNRSRKPAISAAAAAAADASSMSWRTERITRHPRFAALFSAACLIGGCIIFVGALRVHQDLYTYNRVPATLQEQREPSEAQLRIRELLMEKRQAAAMRGKDGKQA
ncbi:hypothetical protein CVIRNUC_002154 [Coccomyxa viridis]|uniref:J domain-containing protein n=1 Tax=Coccomyxa viridis TaxID=1274662 RepID=A0AAV1HW33_9CHLO|nr:hypothetical protein CVIRNUC_002154 [Coccomyxa viridis]